MQGFICVDIFDNIDLKQKKDPNNKDATIDNLQEVIIGVDKVLDSIDITEKKIKEDGKYTIPKLDWLVYQQNKKLNEPILNDNNQLRTNSLGLIEMEASAAYLRKLDSYVIDNDCYELEYNPEYSNKHGKMNVLKAIAVKINEQGCKKHHLGYRFFMLKPQEVLLITNENTDSEKEKVLKKNGIWVVNTEKFVAHLTSGKVYNHQFVVHDNSNKEAKEAIQNYKTALPVRILDDVDVTEWLSFELEKISEKIIECCWCKWSELINLTYDPDGQPDYPTKGNRISFFYDHNVGLDDALINDEYFYCDGLSSFAQNKLPGFKTNLIKYKISLREDSVNRSKVGESIVSKILVIDERIQSACTKSYIEEVITFKRLYEKTCIIVPDHESEILNLSAEIIDKDIFENEDGFIKKAIKDLNIKTDFVLIHYSLLERAFGNEPDRDLAINKYLNEIATKANIVVTTGRGTLKGLTPNVRFVNLSAIIYSFVDLRSKYLSNNILHSSRKSY